MKPIHIKEGIRYFLSSRRAKKDGFKKYKGDAKQICQQIVDDCWNGEFFQTSTRNFKQFWTRDFGMCTEALLKLGYKEKVRKTLIYALKRFEKAGKVTTAITPEGKPFDFPYYAEDSLPFLFHSLMLLNDKELLEEYRWFLDKAHSQYFQNVFDKNRFRVRKDRYFSSIKDYAKRNSSCYGNSMMEMFYKEHYRWHGTGRYNTVKNKVNKLFWNGNYFYEDLNKRPIITGDANVFPFWTKAVDSKKMFLRCLKAMQDAGLDRPLPLKYSNEKPEEIIESIFNPGYEHDNAWLHLGLCFLDVVKKYDKKAFKHYLQRYTRMIEGFGTFPEVLDNKGKPFQTRFYYCDEGMLWASKYLFLRR